MEMAAHSYATRDRGTVNFSFLSEQVRRRRAVPRYCYLGAALRGLVLVASLNSRSFADEQPSSSRPLQPQLVRPDAEASARSLLLIRGDDCWLVSPTGERFFSLGVGVLDQGTSKEAFDSANPSYSRLRHYDTAGNWADAALLRLKSWGFSTIGGWGDYATLRGSDNSDVWLMPVLALGASAGAPWWDMWDEKNLKQMDETARSFITPLCGDKRVIGYYSDNEIGWWIGTLWKMTLEQPSSSGQRQRLISMLHEIYHNDWKLLSQDFEPAGADNWSELDQHGMLWHRPGSNGIRTIRRFGGLVAERYYQLMRDFIHKYDSRALYLGDRYQSFYYPEVAKACGQYADVVSSNLNANWNDGTFLRSYLETLHRLTGKPVLVSEFYMAAHDNRSGDRNSTSSFPTVATQTERAHALSHTLQTLVRLPYVVGAEWFQYYDEPAHGRRDGEDYNFGLVDVDDRPYEEVTTAFSSLNLSKLKAATAPARPDASAGVPRAPTEPFAELRPMRALMQWDRERGFVKPVSDNPIGDLYICWSREAMYLGAYVLDPIDTAYYRDADVPESDRAVWSVQLGKSEPIVARVGGGKPAVHDPTLQVQSLTGVDHNVRCIAIMEVPAERLGKEHFEPGDEIALDVSFVTHGHTDRMEWQGTFSLSDGAR
jgi:hypothetical protein